MRRSLAHLPAEPSVSTDTLKYTATRLAVICSTFVGTTAIASSDGSGMKVSASVDITGSFKTDHSPTDASDASQASDRLDVREAEVTLYGPIDHLFDGTLSLAAHREHGVSLFEIHEAHISTSKLIARSRIKLGQFFPSIGRLNRLHRHEWPFTSAPEVQARFFGAEGIIDSGMEYGFLAPLPFYLDLTAGVTNGWVYGHAHNEGSKPKTPMHYLRMATYSALPKEGGLEVGLNGLSRTDTLGERTILAGIDAVGKWRDGKKLNALIQSEVWHRSRTPPTGAKERNFGAYLFPQVGLTQQASLGVRFDYYTVLTLEDAAGKRIPNKDYGVVPTLTFKPSEFSTLRASYSHMEAYQEGASNRVRRMCELQMTFSLGAHPAHDF